MWRISVVDEISEKFQKRLIGNHCIAYAHSAYDYTRLMWIAVEKQCALPMGFFSRNSNLISAVLEVR